MAKGVPNRYTEAQLAFLKSNQQLPRKELTEMFNEKFGTDYSKDNIKAVCTRRGFKTGRTGRFGKESQPWNKGTVGLMKANSGTWSKDSHPEWNRKPIGYERTHVDGYIMVKVAEPNKFRLKHHVEWEKVNGPVPEGHVIRFKDGNKRNTDVSNLICVKFGVNAILNKKYACRDAESEMKPLLLTMAQIDHKIYENTSLFK